MFDENWSIWVLSSKRAALRKKPPFPTRIRKSGTTSMKCLPSILIEPDFWRCCFNPRFCGNTFWVSCSECLKYNIQSSTWSAAMRGNSMRGCSMRAPREIWSFKITNPNYFKVRILFIVWILFGWIGETIRKQNQTNIVKLQRLVYSRRNRYPWCRRVMILKTQRNRQAKG